MKRRSLTNSSPGSGKTNNAGNLRPMVRQAPDSGTEADRSGKFKKKRKKSSRKNISMASPSSDDTGQGRLNYPGFIVHNIYICMHDVNSYFMNTPLGL